LEYFAIETSVESTANYAFFAGAGTERKKESPARSGAFGSSLESSERLHHAFHAAVAVATTG
jgi:hypothetical protein